MQFKTPFSEIYNDCTASNSTFPPYIFAPKGLTYFDSGLGATGSISSSPPPNPGTEFRFRKRGRSGAQKHLLHDGENGCRGDWKVVRT
ncbi:hypothetical protein CEXT_633771 [Caerostris extrusa]|uniref:Uncharacterized protein n=1 Tax=Caerostris extrusa TaxID=172846 RepID=A0AAV4UNM6_CAEEX|nr:hypothetical protein CEXT_633771 [Caerostris extrusa]